ncbi:hypothetical protein M23134_04345 [Microscilla marina ATCC 23134]|uniref:Uncharacterized protein n=1 Tax=Microscilla marina ATCC 23134 TaxID=313606 RepID=A1ZLW6_MICM2|nr:hypothetical protein M23134_04345 [Microscilla marina ATCC 23134]
MFLHRLFYTFFISNNLFFQNYGYFLDDFKKKKVKKITQPLQVG